MLKYLTDQLASAVQWLAKLFAKSTSEPVPQPTPKPVIFPNVSEHELAVARLEVPGLADLIPPASNEIDFVTASLKDMDRRIKAQFPQAKTCTCTVTNAASRRDVLVATDIARSACLGFQTANSGRYLTRET